MGAGSQSDLAGHGAHNHCLQNGLEDPGVECEIIYTAACMVSEVLLIFQAMARAGLLGELEDEADEETGS